jgi:hypothetical protein
MMRFVQNDVKREYNQMVETSLCILIDKDCHVGTFLQEKESGQRKEISSMGRAPRKESRKETKS